MKYNYQETFELMQAYRRLGARENLIIGYLMTMDCFKGGYNDLAKEIAIDCSNLRNCLLYLDCLGIVNIVKEDNESEAKQIIRKDGILMTINKMKACFLVDGWMEILIKQYRKGLIHSSVPKKNEVIKHFKVLENVENAI